MANLARVRVAWGGGAVIGEGVSTFYFDEAHVGFATDLFNFYDAIKSSFPAGVTWTVPASGDLIDVATGALSGTWTDFPGGTVNSTGSGVFSLGVGARAVWGTSGIRNGRRVKGSTFLVPLAGGAYAADGTLAGATLTSLQSGASALLTASGSNMRIYSQPAPGSGGQSNTVVDASVPDKVSWLRSRRV